MRSHQKQTTQIKNKVNFEVILKELKKNDALLVKESKNTDKGLKQAASSTKRCAEILLIQKCLHRNLLESKVERLPKQWNDFWVHYPKSLPRHKDNIQVHFNSNVNKGIARIDNLRKHVGDTDIKIFHALDVKDKWKTQDLEPLGDPSNDIKNYNDDIYFHQSYGLDNEFNNDDNWSRIDLQHPHEHHQCHYIGHSRHKCPDMEEIQRSHWNKCQRYQKADNFLDQRKTAAASQHKRQTYHVPHVTTY
jgi:hypothetical protein